MTKARKHEIPPEQADELTSPDVEAGSPLSSETTDQGVSGGGHVPGPAAAPRKRRPKDPQEPVSLDPNFINDPARMQYALLLALLLRQHGNARFTKKDLDHEENEYNILFARTLDGQGLEVTVVSAQSGIIRSPERQREAESWSTTKQQRALAENASIFQTLPHLPPSSDAPPDNLPPELANHPAAAFFRLHQMQSPYQTGIQQQGPPSPATLQPGMPAAAMQPPAQVVQFPEKAPTEPADGSAAYHFPFQVGESPTTAAGLNNLDLLQSRLLKRDQQLAAEQAAAIQRMEDEGLGVS